MAYFKNRGKVLQDLVLSHTKTKLGTINELLKVLSDYTNLKTLALC
jgi:hypothetical protein